MKKLNYITLFSSAGVGCYGFQENGYECIATNELLDSRIEIQRINSKCLFSEGYVTGDITEKAVKDKLFTAIRKYQAITKNETIDVIIATPPCQGMSTANYKKKNETTRNSLVIEAIHLVKEIGPRIFIFENVSSFLKTICVDADDQTLKIEEAIDKHLFHDYNIYSKVVNFKDYGVPSSRPRTLVIGTLKSITNIAPLNLFPDLSAPVSVREAISDLPSLEYGEIDRNDIFHFFREYPIYMRDWIRDLKEGQSAFQNELSKRPYKLVDGKRQSLKGAYLGNKFRRMIWDAPAPCIATRNDQLASQSTIHPEQDRVLSIRELMRVMAVPDSFRWTVYEPILTDNEAKKQFLKKHELNVRRSIGEAVPTLIFSKIASKIRDLLEYDCFLSTKKKNTSSNYYINSYIYETQIAQTKETGSFYTPQSVVFDALKKLDLSDKRQVRILEPSVGMGAFLPQLINLVTNDQVFIIDVVDLDCNVLRELELNIQNIRYNKSKIFINYKCTDFVSMDANTNYDLIIGNPPFVQLKGSSLKYYRQFNPNLKSNNLFGFFIDKAKRMSSEIILVMPKSFLMIPEFNKVRKDYEDFGIVSVFDYGVKYFAKVFIEILVIHFNKSYRGKVSIESKIDNKQWFVDQRYIYHDRHWIIYRNEFFDEFINHLMLDVFNFYRDRQITNKTTKPYGKYWVIRSKNILDDGTIIHKDGYDKYIDDLGGLHISKYLNTRPVIFVSFTYNTRATILPNNAVANGSIAILIPQIDIDDTLDISFYSTQSFRDYYAIVKNKSKFTINIDSNSVYYIGVRK